MTEKQLKKKILDSGRTLLFSNEDLKRLIIPLVIDQVLVRTVGMADTMRFPPWARRRFPACRWWI
ncbi:MAG: hypothetical protein ACLSIR_08150 [Christensenellales bacterium]